MHTSIVFVPCLMVAVTAADCSKDSVMAMWGSAFYAAMGALPNLADDSHMCQYVDGSQACKAKATEQDCISGSECVWSSETSKCSFPSDALFNMMLSFPAASAGGKLFEKGQACSAKKQSDCSNGCVWAQSENICGLDYGDMCSEADVKSTAEAWKTCAAMSPPCTGDAGCEEKAHNGAAYCTLKQSTVLKAMFGDKFAQTLTTAIDNTATCSVAGSEETCSTGCTRNMFGCGKQKNPIMTEIMTKSSTCQEAKEKANCTAPCEWQAKEGGGECEVSGAWASTQCKPRGGADFAHSSFEPVNMLLSIIVLHAAAFL